MDYAIALGKLKRFAMKDAGKALVEEGVRIPVPVGPWGRNSEVTELDEGDGKTTATRVRFEQGDVYLYGVGRVRDSWPRRRSGRAKCRMCMVPKGKTFDDVDINWSLKHGLGKLLGGSRTERLGCTQVTVTMQMNHHSTSLRFIIQVNWRKPYPYQTGDYGGWLPKPGAPVTEVTWSFDESDIDPMSNLVPLCRGFVASGYGSVLLDYLSEFAPDTEVGSNGDTLKGLYFTACCWSAKDRWDDESPVEPIAVFESLYEARRKQNSHDVEVEARGHKFHFADPATTRVVVTGVGTYPDFWAAWRAVLASEQRAKDAAEAKAKLEAEDALHKSFRVMVQTAGDGDSWSGNAMRYSTRQKAQEAGSDLAWRWTAVKTYRVEGTQDEANAA